MKTQEEYALEIDEIVRRDVESRQSDYQAMWLSFVQGLVFTRKDIKDIGMTYSIGR